jgi:sugar phosphate isomerase/epimerase
MSRLKIGVRLESLGLPFRKAVEEAEKQGAAGVQFDAAGPLAPEALSQTGRREIRHLLRSHNLEASALGCPLRHGLDILENQEGRIEHVRAAMNLAFDLGPRVVVIEPGRISDDDQDPRTFLLRDALRSLGQHGDRVGTTLALETGLESGQALRGYLDRFDTGSLGVNLDPANLLLHGFDPYAGARALGPKVVHAHAKDVRQAGASRSAQEVPLGHGDLDWMLLLGILEEIDYHGWVVVERESGDNRLAEVRAGVDFLKRFVGSAG